MSVHGWICGPRTYEFEGWNFEYGPSVVWPLKKNGEPRQRAGKKFYSTLDRFCQLTDEQKIKHRTGGGCVAF